MKVDDALTLIDCECVRCDEDCTQCLRSVCMKDSFVPVAKAISEQNSKYKSLVSSINNAILNIRMANTKTKEGNEVRNRTLEYLYKALDSIGEQHV